MSDQHVAATDRGLSTADLASAVPEQDSRETDRTDGFEERPEHLEDRDAEAQDFESEEDLADERHGEFEDEPVASTTDEPVATTTDEPVATTTDEPAEPAPSTVTDEASPALFDQDKVTSFRDRWQIIQTGFVDDPHQSVREADELVAAVISELANTFAEHKSELEGQWRQGEPATEELRVALRRYRAFFDELLPR